MDTEKEDSKQHSSKPGNEIAQLIERFLHVAEGLNASLPLLMVILGAAQKQAEEKYSEYLSANGSLIEELEKSSLYRLPPVHYLQARRLRRKHEKTSSGVDLLPQAFLISLVSQYDSFLGRLLRSIFLLRPELLVASERQLTLAELLRLGSVGQATEFILEKEIESVLRRSHEEQFAWMEKKFDVALRKDLERWGTFIEITERRNLFAHAAGQVSSQYMEACSRHNVAWSQVPKIGETLRVDLSYFRSAYWCIVELAVKLAHVLWRKLAPAQMESADKSLINTTYELIVEEQYELAIRLLEFACFTLKKYSDQESRLTFMVNLAQAYKWTGCEDKCNDMLAKSDWSATADKFRLAVAVLRNDFEGAAAVMRRSGSTGEIRDFDYRDWPLFKEFRESTHFLEAFLDVFGKEFSEIQEAELTPKVTSGESLTPVELGVL